MNTVQFYTRTFLPGAIYSGAIYSENSSELMACIETLGGSLTFSFQSGMRALAFAKALMMSTLREERKITNPKQFRPEAETELVGSEKSLFPFLPGERILDRLESGFTWEAMCCFTSWNDQIFSHRMLHSVISILIHCWTCGCRPYQYRSEVVFSNTAVFSLVRRVNYGLFGFNFWETGPCCDGFFGSKTFFLAWNLISEIDGHSLQVSAHGTETCLRRCCPMPCCPLSHATYVFEVKAGHFAHRTRDDKVNKNWHVEESLLKYRNNLDVLLQEVRSATIPVAERV